MAATHDIIVKVGLTADQYLWMHHEAEALGLSDSAFVRQLIQQQRRRDAMSTLSPNGLAYEMADSAQNRA